MEKLMQYVWQYRLIPRLRLTTVDGRRVSIINPGTINHDAGPDFFNADIRIDNQQWVGNIEIHVKASDWFRHGHDKDKAYDSVILHVVQIDDVPVFRSNGELIPQMQLNCAVDLGEHYSALTTPAPTDLSCAMHLSSIPSVYLSDWITSLATERLQAKADMLRQLANSEGGDWNEALYIVMARALGFGKNSEPFERLARATPLRYMLRHRDNLTAIEAVLFGQAGMLSGNIAPDNEYQSRLADEYRFYAAKFGLKRPVSLNWKMSRLRPQNTPYRRIAYLAALINADVLRHQKFVECNSIESLRTMLSCRLSGHWERHYTFGTAESPYEIVVSRSTLDLLIINAVIPAIYARGVYLHDPSLTDRAIDLMQMMKPENNSLVRMFTERGIRCNDAFTSQGLIQLRRVYCEQRQCLNCRIGHRILSRAAVEY